MLHKKYIGIIIIVSILFLILILIAVGSLFENNKKIITKYVCADGIVVSDKTICATKDSRILSSCPFQCCVDEPSISGYVKRNCPSGFYCNGNSCSSKPLCNSNSDCDITKVCTNGECVTETISN